MCGELSRDRASKSPEIMFVCLAKDGKFMLQCQKPGDQNNEFNLVCDITALFDFLCWQTNIKM